MSEEPGHSNSLETSDHQDTVVLVPFTMFALAEVLNHKSKHVEEAVKELISIFETIYEVKYSGKGARHLPGNATG